MVKYDFATRYLYPYLPAFRDPAPSLGERLRTHVDRILAKKAAMRDI